MVRPHNCFDMVHEIIEGDERKLGFEMRVFAQMAASVTLGGWVGRISTRDATFTRRTGSPVLCSETFLHAVYVAQRWETGLEVQLRTLSQKRWLPIIFQFEQGRTAFDLCLHETWRGDLDHMTLCVGGTEGREHRGAKSEHAACVLAAQDKMTEIRQDGGIRFLHGSRLTTIDSKKDSTLVQDVPRCAGW